MSENSNYAKIAETLEALRAQSTTPSSRYTISAEQWVTATINAIKELANEKIQDSKRRGFEMHPLDLLTEVLSLVEGVYYLLDNIPNNALYKNENAR